MPYGIANVTVRVAVCVWLAPLCPFSNWHGFNRVIVLHQGKSGTGDCF
jgi:hypothetical protein